MRRREKRIITTATAANKKREKQIKKAQKMRFYFVLNFFYVEN